MDTFRAQLHRIADWVADYRETVGDQPVLARTRPDEIAAALPTAAPETPDDLGALLTDLDQTLMPGITHWNHPKFFAYFPANNSEPSILAELVTAAIGAQCMSWQTSPAATELEQVVMGWLRDLLGLADHFEGVIQDTASSATLVAILMARERCTGGRFRTEGAAADGADRLRVYASAEAHSSVEKAVFLSGIGSRNLRRIAVIEDLSMDPQALDDAIRADLDQGLIPCAVVATVGTTSTTAVDPVESIADVCGRHGVFLHVDAAFVGNLAILPERRHLLAGCDHADSVVVNPHKWMYVNFDCSAHWVKDVDLLLGALAIDPEYLKTAADPRVRNYRDWGIPLGRRFRALKLWWVLRSFGAEGIRERLRHALDLASRVRANVEAATDLELAAPQQHGLVCFRHRREGLSPEGEDEVNRRVLERLNAGGTAYITHTRVGGRYVLRWHTGQALTQEADVDEAWADLRAAIEATPDQ